MRPRRYRLLTKGEAALVALNAALVPPSLWASSRLLSAAAVLMGAREPPLAVLAIFANNSIAAALVALAALTIVRLAWAWGLSGEAVSRRASVVAPLLVALIFAVSLVIRAKLVSPLVVLLPHFWLEYLALSLAAYAGFRASPRYLALSFAVLALAAGAEVGVAIALAR